MVTPRCTPSATGYMPFEAKFPRGTAPGLLGEGKAMAICKDMDFPDTIRNDAHVGLRLMAVPAWDSGVDAWIHARMAVLRAVLRTDSPSHAQPIMVSLPRATLTAGNRAKGRRTPDQIDWILSDLSAGTRGLLYIPGSAMCFPGPAWGSRCYCAS